jgi:hypothetical protein
MVNLFAVRDRPFRQAGVARVGFGFVQVVGGKVTAAEYDGKN